MNRTQGDKRNEEMKEPVAKDEIPWNDVKEDRGYKVLSFVANDELKSVFGDDDALLSFAPPMRLKSAVLVVVMTGKQQLCPLSQSSHQS